ncbi:hypothetical protein MMC17_002103 [Xylographa soralifera]|nr:hypothetical protein [Xylographa soralifera]
MPTTPAERNDKSSTGEDEPTRASTKKQVALSLWTGDSSENGVDECVETPNEKEPTQEKCKEAEPITGGEGETEKKAAKSEPTPPINPMPATPSRPFPRRKGIRETKTDGDRRPNRERDEDGYVEGGGPELSFALMMELGLGL